MPKLVWLQAKREYLGRISSERLHHRRERVNRRLSIFSADSTGSKAVSNLALCKYSGAVPLCGVSLSKSDVQRGNSDNEIEERLRQSTKLASAPGNLDKPKTRLASLR